MFVRGLQNETFRRGFKSRYIIYKLFFSYRLFGYDNQCCYNEDGTLTNPDEPLGRGSGFINRYHYKGGRVENLPHLSNFYYDILPINIVVCSNRTIVMHLTSAARHFSIDDHLIHVLTTFRLVQVTMELHCIT